MTPTIDLTCEAFRREDAALRFVTGEARAAARDRFESHMLTCEQCQSDVLFASAVRSALRETENVATTRGSRRTSAGWWYRAGGIVAATAAFVLVARSWPSTGGSVRALGQVIVAPVYLGVPVRAAADTIAAARFDRAMQVYASERYEEASNLLEATITAGNNTPPSQFFHASALLMTGHARDAVAGFDKVIAFGDSPYLPEAYFYRAKARLQLGDAGAALQDLRMAARGTALINAQARALADSVRAIDGVGRR